MTVPEQNFAEINRYVFDDSVSELADAGMEPKQAIKVVFYLTLSTGWFFLFASPLNEYLNLKDSRPDLLLPHLVCALSPTIGWIYVAIMTPDSSD